MAPAVMAGVIGPNGLPLNANFLVEAPSYSEIIEVRPKSNQAIVMELSNNKEISNEKYIDALLDLVKAEEITHISRISRNRLCVYLTTASKAAELVDVNKCVIVDGEEVKITHLISKSIKVTISNADASISNTAIKRFLNHVCKIRTASSVSELKVNTSSDRLKNVLSFRRLVYIHPEDVSKLPSSQKFKGDGATWNVFFNTGNPKCFVCGSEDHFAKQCTETGDLSQSVRPQQTQSMVGDGENTTTGVNIDSADSLPLPSYGSTYIQEPLISTLKPMIPTATELMPTSMLHPENNIYSISDNMETSPSQNFKRPLSTSSSELSNKVDNDGFVLQTSYKNK